MPTVLPNKIIVIALLLMASSLGAMSTDLYTPSMPYLSEYFGVSPGKVQLTLFVNAVALGLAQLVLGPLSDRVGRRPVFLWGVVLFSVFSAACALSTDINQLIGARALQGAASAAQIVLTLAILMDLFDERQRVRVLAIYGMLFALTPALAPILGGYIHVWLGWQANFWLLVLLGVALSLGIWRFMPETITERNTEFNPVMLAKRYWRLIENKGFMMMALMMGMIVGGLFVFIASAPFIIIDHYGIATERFGFFQVGMIGSYIIGSYLASKLVDRWETSQLLHVGLTLLVTGALLLIVFEFLLTPSLSRYLIGISTVMFALGPLWAVVPSVTMERSHSSPGISSALFGALEMAGAGIGVALLAALDLPISQAATLSIALLTVFTLVFYFWSRRYP
jgi:DHA1 family bicyclomycin/chloramphenicol resistance-like MFS transporter